MDSSGTDITLKLYGLTYEKAGLVRADVFAKKLTAFVNGLKSADKAINGQKTFEYLISDLQCASAAAKINEHIHNRNKIPQRSSADYYYTVTNAISAGKGAPTGTPLPLLKSIRDISSKADEDFSHGELTYGKGVDREVVRIDDYLHRRVSAELDKLEGDAVLTPSMFSGIAYGSFDGVLKEVDLRGTIRRAKLFLRIGDIELDCICSSISVEELGAALDKRVIVYAAAIYDGIEKLPIRLDIKKMEVLGSPMSLRKWAGAFDIRSDPEEQIW